MIIHLFSIKTDIKKIYKNVKLRLSSPGLNFFLKMEIFLQKCETLLFLYPDKITLFYKIFFH